VSGSRRALPQLADLAETILSQMAAIFLTRIEILRALSMRFPRHAESIGPMWPKSKSKPNPGVRTVPPPAGRPRAQVKERVGRAASFSSSAMSSGRLFLDRVARQHCPSPLHRRSQINMHFWDAWAKDDISNLPGRRHFYFALTPSHTLPIALDQVEELW
jgi:hypothetical protein